MSAPAALYVGTVSHKRLRPTPHALAYRVFSVLLDVDAIAEAAAASRIFSYNRAGLVSFFDRDHGPGDGTPVARHIREVLSGAGIDVSGGRILLLAYPRILGYVFNPLSVFYAFGSDGRLAALVYEVNNTFGERTSYVVRAGSESGGVYAQAAAKLMHVSPFTESEGRYGFRVTEPAAELLVAVLLRDREGPLLKTYFKAERVPLTDRALLGCLMRLPMMTFKVTAAIHLEALKLWLKGIAITERHRSPAYRITNVDQRGLS